MLNHTLHLLYASDIPLQENARVAYLTDDKAMLTGCEAIERTSEKLQIATDNTRKWKTKMRIKRNGSK